VHPTWPTSRFFADSWMLFPTEAEYLEWFEKAGFEDVKLTRIGPWWYHGVRRHGLIMGCSVTGTKKTAGPAKLQMGPKIEQRAEDSRPKNSLTNILRLALGTAAGFYYFVVPVYMFLKHLLLLPLSLVWKDAHKKLM
jgi:MPBQ/MSBQ methyltransferase